MSEQRYTPQTEAVTASTSAVRRRWPRSVRATIGIILYVFSIGPMFWYWYESENLGGNPLVRVVYAPLRLLCTIPQVEEWLNNYINWWIA